MGGRGAEREGHTSGPVGGWGAEREGHTSGPVGGRGAEREGHTSGPVGGAQRGKGTLVGRWVGRREGRTH